jgi:hypothetical protein
MAMTPSTLMGMPPTREGSLCNAGRQARRAAGAQQTLAAVACTRSLGLAPRTAFHISFAALGASTGQSGQKLRNMRQHQIAAAETFQMIEIRQRDKCHLGDMFAALLYVLVGPVLCARH